MILAAGLGTRMRPLTDNCPKPLLLAGGKALIDYHLERLQAFGVEHIVINSHWLSGQVQQHVSHNWSNNLSVEVIHEDELLETAGGIINALPKLTDASDTPFLVINGDIFFEASLQECLESMDLNSSRFQAHLFMVENPDHNETGDFSLKMQPAEIQGSNNSATYSQYTLTHQQPQNSHTYSGVALFRPSMFRALATGPRPLGPILRARIDHNEISGSVLPGYWLDVGTPARLSLLEKHLQTRN